MTPEEVRELLVGTVFGPVAWVHRTGSTNFDLLAAARSGAPEGAVLVADHQTGGRGRRGRSWVAPPGSALLASVLLRPRAAGGGTALLSPATALAVRDACASMGAEVRLKWPNDVIARVPEGATTSGRRAAAGRAEVVPEQAAEPVTPPLGGEAKLAGVLAELHAGPEGEVAVVAGFGVNLRSQGSLTAAVAAEVDTDPESGFAPLPPVALEAIAARPPDRNELLVSVLLRLDAWYRRLQDPRGERDLLGALRRHSATLGCQVRVLTPGGSVAGRATDLTAEGHLVVTTAAGPVTITAGDCHHLRSGTA